MSDEFEFESDQFYSDNDDIVYDSDSGMVDEFGDGFETLEQEKKTKKSYEVEFKCYSFNGLRELQNKEIASIKDIFQMDEEIIHILLRKYRWNKDRVTELITEDVDKLYEESGIGVLLDKSSFKPEIEIKNGFFCPICCDDSPNQKVLKLHCGDEICLNCHKTFLEQKIYNGISRDLRCIGNCGTPYTSSVIKKIVSCESYLRFIELVNNSFVEDKTNFKFCPGASCTYSFYCDALDKTQNHTILPVECGNGHKICFGCSLEEHAPCHCSLADAWLKKCMDDSETFNWLNSYTKECPKCQSTIEKNGGCNHMTCRKCHYEFCWVCMGGWKNHGSEWYSCNRYNEDESKATRTKQEESRANLKRYIHYYNRYANHLQSSKLDEELYKKIEEKMETMQKESTFSWIEVQFLKAAVDVLVKARSTLRWTYAFIYYLEQDNNKHLFEDNQQDLELNTEALSGLLTQPIEKETIAVLKQKVMDKAYYVSLRNDILIEDAIKGFQENRWKYIEGATKNDHLTLF